MANDRYRYEGYRSRDTGWRDKDEGRFDRDRRGSDYDRDGDDGYIARRGFGNESAGYDRGYDERRGAMQRLRRLWDGRLLPPLARRRRRGSPMGRILL